MHGTFYHFGYLNHNVVKRKSKTRQATMLGNALRNFVQAKNQVLTNIIVYQDNTIEYNINFQDFAQIPFIGMYIHKVGGGIKTTSTRTTIIKKSGVE